MDQTLDPDEEGDVERILIGDSVVIRKGTHYKVDIGGEDIPRVLNNCDCGKRLLEGRCRECGRYYTG